MQTKTSTILLCFLLYSLHSMGQTFKIIPLGVHGGLEENNLSLIWLQTKTVTTILLWMQALCMQEWKKRPRNILKMKMLLKR
ncbi:hypothetical protein [Polluticoccus soli]